MMFWELLQKCEVKARKRFLKCSLENLGVLRFHSIIGTVTKVLTKNQNKEHQLVQLQLKDKY